MHSIAIFGGTFDPIHNGHLITSETIQTHFKFASYFFLPCKIPLLKSASIATESQRIEMIKLAIKKISAFKLDLREIERASPSYMVDTLQSYRSEYPDASISLIMGYDAFFSLYLWHQWEKIITLANLLVINRSQFAHEPLPAIMQEFLQTHQLQNKEMLINTSSGAICLFDAGNYDISSTAVRNEIKKGVDVKNKLPLSVYSYIKAQVLYQ
jgi:nicotinate-nucleotide adenylyltransferase